MLSIVISMVGWRSLSMLVECFCAVERWSFAERALFWAPANLQLKSCKARKRFYDRFLIRVGKLPFWVRCRRVLFRRFEPGGLRDGVFVLIWLH